MLRDNVKEARTKRFYLETFEKWFERLEKKGECAKKAELQKVFLELYDKIDYYWQLLENLKIKNAKMLKEYESIRHALAILKHVEHLEQKEREAANEEEDSKGNS